MSATVLWVIAAILVIVGIVQLIQGFIILAIAALEVVNRLPAIRSRLARRSAAQKAGV